MREPTPALEVKAYEELNAKEIHNQLRASGKLDPPRTRASLRKDMDLTASATRVFPSRDLEDPPPGSPEWLSRERKKVLFFKKIIFVLLLF